MPRLSVGAWRSAARTHGAGFIARTTTWNAGVASSVFRVFGVRLEAQPFMRDRFAGLSIIAAGKVKDGTVQFHIEIRAWGA